MRSGTGGVPGGVLPTAQSIYLRALPTRFTYALGPKGNAVYWSSGTYLDIVPNARIVSAGTMHEGEKRTSLTMCTLELIAEGQGTRFVLTDQSAFLDGAEAPADRKSGWGKIIARLARHLSARASI